MSEGAIGASKSALPILEDPSWIVERNVQDNHSLWCSQKYSFGKPLPRAQRATAERRGFSPPLIAHSPPFHPSNPVAQSADIRIQHLDLFPHPRPSSP